MIFDPSGKIPLMVTETFRGELIKTYSDVYYEVDFSKDNRAKRLLLPGQLIQRIDQHQCTKD